MASAEYRCYVGGLAWSTTDQSLHQAFSQFGQVFECRIINDRQTGRSRGFGFVTFKDEQAMRDAIQTMNGQHLYGRIITVNEAQPRGRGRGSDGGGGGGGDKIPPPLQNTLEDSKESWQPKKVAVGDKIIPIPPPQTSLEDSKESVVPVDGGDGHKIPVPPVQTLEDSVAAVEGGDGDKIPPPPPVQTLEDSEETVEGGDDDKIPRRPPLQFLEDHTANALLSVKRKTIAKKKRDGPLTYLVKMNREEVVRGILETHWAAPHTGKIWKKQQEEPNSTN